jgi:predicted NUDIX family NTP pyrophosphohydrolase
MDASAIVSNRVEMEWPRGSGRTTSFPEVDRAEWVGPERARAALVAGQAPAIDALLELLGG